MSPAPARAQSRHHRMQRPVARAGNGRARRAGRRRVSGPPSRSADSQSRTAAAVPAGSRRRSCRLAGADLDLDGPAGSRYPERVPVAVDHQRRHAGGQLGRPRLTVRPARADAAGRPARPRPAAPSARRGPAGHPGAAGPAADDQRQRGRRPGAQRRDHRRPGLVQLARRQPARAGRRPGTAGSPGPPRTPAASAGSRTATRSGASTPPPAPWPSTSRRDRRRAGTGRVDVDLARAPERGVALTGRRGSHPAHSAAPPTDRGVAPHPVRPSARTAPAVSSAVAHRRPQRRRTASGPRLAPRSAPGDQHRPALPGVVPPQTPWQSPTSSAQARQAPWTSQVRQSATAASAGSLGAGKNVSGSTLRHTPRVRQASSVCRSSHSPQQSRVASSGRDLVRAWHPRPGHPPTSPVGPDKSRGKPSAPCGSDTPHAGAVFYRTITSAETRGLSSTAAKSGRTFTLTRQIAAQCDGTAAQKSVSSSGLP